jgi:YgiT-type zinc finger domain-containing protein
VKEMKEKDLCDLCGGELGYKKVNLELHIQKELVICEDLPADVCKQCGEKYFDAEVSKKIDEFIKKYKKEKPLRYIPVPVFSGELVLE